MEKRVIFQSDMDVSPADFNNLQDHVQVSAEHIVGDAISGGRKFAGFATVASNVTTITAQPGRLFSGGKVFASAAVFTHDFTNVLPVGAKRIASLCVFGNEPDTDMQAREFLLNEETGASEPRVVALTRARLANLTVSLGQEAADPVPPNLDAGVLEIAQVLLTATGIGAVTMTAANRLDSVAGVATRVADVEQFVEGARPKIAALSSDIASIKTAVAAKVDEASYVRLLTRLAVAEAKAGIPAAATGSEADFFGDESKSDPAFAGYSARVEEGVRFGPAAGATTQLGIFNALNPAAKIVNGWLFPAFDTELRMTSGPAQGEVALATYTYQAFEMKWQQASRERLRYGHGFRAIDGLHYQQLDDYTVRVFSYQPDELEHDAAGNAIGYRPTRIDNFWHDAVESPYWSRKTVDQVVPGAQIAETFLNGSDQWLAAVGLTFTRLAAAGNVTLAICETERGVAVLDKAISLTTIQRQDMLLGGETRVPIQPVFLTGGKRYAIVVISSADHWLATTNGENFPGGTFFGVLDGAYQQGDASRDLCFSLYAAKFRAARAVIEMQGLQLAGGIVDIDILAGTIAPGSTELAYEVQVNNAWVPLAAAPVVALNAGGALPPLVPLRLVFTGTPDVMPAVQLTDSQVRVTRPATALVHVSKIRNLPAPSTQIRVIGRLERFDAAHHAAVAKLRTGAGYATLTAASSVVDVAVDGGAIERTWVFNLGAAVSLYRIQVEGSTDSVFNAFHLASRKDYAL